MNYTIELIAGDPSGDGHKMTDNLIISSNLTRDQIRHAYKVGTALVGFDLTKEVAADYEDSTISYERLMQLKNAGVDLSDWNLPEDEDEPVEFCCTEFFDLYLAIVKLGSSEFEYTEMDSQSESIYVGGYGFGY